MDGWMDGWVDGWMHGWMDGWMHGWMDGCMDGRMDGWMEGWMIHVPLTALKKRVRRANSHTEPPCSDTANTGQPVPSPLAHGSVHTSHRGGVGSILGPILLEFLVDKAAKGQVILGARQLSSDSITPQMLHTHYYLNTTPL